MCQFSEYRVASWRIGQLDMLARRVLSALATVEEAEARLTAVRDGRRPAVFDQSYYEDEVGRADEALRDVARRMAAWSISGAAAAVPGSAPPIARSPASPPMAAAIAPSARRPSEERPSG